jgi:hypothetical protein
MDCASGKNLFSRSSQKFLLHSIVPKPDALKCAGCVGRSYPHVAAVYDRRFEGWELATVIDRRYMDENRKPRGLAAPGVFKSWFYSIN